MFGEIFINIISYCPEMKILMCPGQKTVKHRWNLLISSPKPDLCNINAHTKFGENPLLFTRYCQSTKNQTCCWQITLSKIDEIISGPKPDLHNINAHTKFGENPLTFTQVIIQKWQYWRTDAQKTDWRMDRQMDKRTHRRPMWNHNIQPLASGGV